MEFEADVRDQTDGGQARDGRKNKRGKSDAATFVHTRGILFKVENQPSQLQEQAPVNVPSVEETQTVQNEMIAPPATIRRPPTSMGGVICWWNLILAITCAAIKKNTT